MSNPTEENYFNNLCHYAGVGLIGTDEHLNIRFWNRISESVFGKTAQEITGKPAISIFADDRQDEIFKLFKRAINERKISGFEFEYTDHNNENKHLAITISPIVDDNQTGKGISLCVRDITLKNELLRDVAESQKMSALDLMAGAVAHHFNNLIGGIITSIDFALNSGNAKIYRRTLQTTMDTLNRANRLTLSLLAFAEGGHKDTITDEVTEIVNRYIESIRIPLEEKNITLEADIHPVNAHVTTKQLATVLDHLIDNCCEAMPEGGKIRIELRLTTDSNNFVIEVHDTGVGIQQRDLDRVFEPFFTTKNDDEYNPTQHPGLGLAVVHGIVKEMGGIVTLAPAPEGTVCTIRLPIKMRP
ncbi:MAG: PAS domain S-box protein [Planctomycetota bacterium]|nr:MAG: PAS domain S-box protein [Planctomycetota bacterium]